MRYRGLNIFEIVWLGAAVMVVIWVSEWVARMTNWPVGWAITTTAAVLVLPLILFTAIGERRRR